MADLVEILEERARGGLSHDDDFERAAEEIKRLRAALVQVRGYAAVMEPNNWRDLRLHIERQCNVLDRQSTQALRQCPGCGREEPTGTGDTCPYCDVRYDCEDRTIS